MVFVQALTDNVNTMADNASISALFLRPFCNFLIVDCTSANYRCRDCKYTISPAVLAAHS
jgi:hypothetical protein